MQKEGVLYFIDRVTVLFKQTTGFIANHLDLKKLKAEHGIQPELLTPPKDSSTWIRGYRALLDMTLPTKEALEYIKDRVAETEHAVSYIELARDEFFSTRKEAEGKLEFERTHVRKKYSSEVFVFDSEKSSVSSKPFFSKINLYLGKKDFQCVAYARPSKINGLPCFHSEWMMQGTKQVKAKIKVRTIGDLIELNIEEQHLKLTKDFLKYEEIDHERFGRFVAMVSWQYVKKIAKRWSERFPRLPLIGPRRWSHAKMRLLDIDPTPALLRQSLVELKKDVMEKEKRGENLTTWEKRIRKLSSQKLNTFFKNVA
jgi:hypothetical protein